MDDWFTEISNVGEGVHRDDLVRWASFTTRDNLAVDCLIDRDFEVGRASTVYLFENNATEPFGLAYVRIREDELVLSNMDLGSHLRKGIGTLLVRELLAEFPDLQLRGEEPNLKALGWHKHLETEFGDRVIPFSEAEIQRTHKLWGSEDA